MWHEGGPSCHMVGSSLAGAPPITPFCALPLCSESLSINNVPDHRLPLAWDSSVGGAMAFQWPWREETSLCPPPASLTLHADPHSGHRDGDPREGVAPPKPQPSLEADVTLACSESHQLTRLLVTQPLSCRTKVGADLQLPSRPRPQPLIALALCAVTHSAPGEALLGGSICSCQGEAGVQHGRARQLALTSQPHPGSPDPSPPPAFLRPPEAGVRQGLRPGLPPLAGSSRCACVNRCIPCHMHTRVRTHRYLRIRMPFPQPLASQNSWSWWPLGAAWSLLSSDPQAVLGLQQPHGVSYCCAHVQ